MRSAYLNTAWYMPKQNANVERLSKMNREDFIQDDPMSGTQQTAKVPSAYGWYRDNETEGQLEGEAPVAMLVGLLTIKVSKE
jgi:hypothetical protein